MLITTCSSLLLSKRHIFTRTNPRGTSATRDQKQHYHANENGMRFARRLN